MHKLFQTLLLPLPKYTHTSQWNMHSRLWAWVLPVSFWLIVITVPFNLLISFCCCLFLIFKHNKQIQRMEGTKNYKLNCLTNKINSHIFSQKNSIQKERETCVITDKNSLDKTEWFELQTCTPSVRKYKAVHENGAYPKI